MLKLKLMNLSLLLAWVNWVRIPSRSRSPAEKQYLCLTSFLYRVLTAHSAKTTALQPVIIRG